jgi:hypothetical protein
MQAPRGRLPRGNRFGARDFLAASLAPLALLSALDLGAGATPSRNSGRDLPNLLCQLPRLRRLLVVGVQLDHVSVRVFMIVALKMPCLEELQCGEEDSLRDEDLEMAQTQTMVSRAASARASRQARTGCRALDPIRRSLRPAARVLNADQNCQLHMTAAGRAMASPRSASVRNCLQLAIDSYLNSPNCSHDRQMVASRQHTCAHSFPWPAASGHVAGAVEELVVKATALRGRKTRISQTRPLLYSAGMVQRPGEASRSRLRFVAHFNAPTPCRCSSMRFNRHTRQTAVCLRAAD